MLRDKDSEERGSSSVIISSLEYLIRFTVGCFLVFFAPFEDPVLFILLLIGSTVVYVGLRACVSIFSRRTVLESGCCYGGNTVPVVRGCLRVVVVVVIVSLLKQFQPPSPCGLVQTRAHAPVSR